jgi:hypothetical protein
MTCLIRRWVVDCDLEPEPVLEKIPGISRHVAGPTRSGPFIGVMIVTIFSLLIPFIGGVLHPLIVATWGMRR